MFTDNIEIWNAKQTTTKIKFENDKKTTNSRQQKYVLHNNCAILGIKCYKCNSHYDKRCGDTFNNYTTELINCEQVGHKTIKLSTILTI